TTHVAPINSRDSRLSSLDLLWRNSNSLSAYSITQKRADRALLSSESFRINYPESLSQREVSALLTFLESTQKSLAGRVTAAGFSVKRSALEIFVNETTGDFVGRTGQPPWAAAATNGRRIELQPFATLKKRGLLETTLRHELMHTMIE